MPRLSKIGAAALAAFGWTGLQSVTASYLVVAGGGGGGGNCGGGGGAGGLLSGTSTLNPTLSYTVTVGAGGVNQLGNANISGGNGGNSVFNSITSTGGGGGGGWTLSGSSGGSGGGGGNSYTGSTSGGSGTSGQGNSGGGSSGGSSQPFVGAGGGGASAVGANASGANGAGGAGTASSISGSSVTYAGGGGGGGYNASGTLNGGAGGAGGGGAGGNSVGGVTTSGIQGTANTGGGGGGSGGSAPFSGTGGSGVVIISYPAPQQFGGGVVTTSGSNVIHTFNTSGTLTPLSSLTASYLIVAGGGGSGRGSGTGGGGAGGFLTGSGVIIDTNSNYVITVGAGGAGGTTSAPYTGSSGSNSVFSAYATAAVGGGGGGSDFVSPPLGLTGGSGGGSASAASATVYAGGAGTSGQGNTGGSGGGTSGYYIGGGGGGAGAVGGNASSRNGGNGGVGLANPIAGSTVGQLVSTTYYLAGGGAGGGDLGGGGVGGSGGTGGGGGINTAGTANTGGGGGGRNASANGVGADGGSGVVIISYAGATQLMAGGTVTITGGNVIHTFTSSGYLTPIKYVNNSLRFRSSASAYLSRTPATAGNRKTWTWSAWVKRANIGTTSELLGSDGTTNNTNFAIEFSGDTLYIGLYSIVVLQTTAVYRDPAAWYHIVVAFDSTQSTASNRTSLYVNGVQVTVFGTDNRASITQNGDYGINNNTIHNIGRNPVLAARYFDGYMTEVNLIDGQALTPNSFGTINSYGVWQPITYGGSYGTNGFYLPFTNTTSATTLAYDFSPNGNNWTPNNISTTAGSTYDSMTDVPTLTSATAANYAVWNPLDKGAVTVTDGNLTAVPTVSGTNGIRASMGLPLSGKFYWEITVSGLGYGVGLGIANAASDLITGPSSAATRTYQFGSWFNTYNSGVVQYGTNQSITGGTNWSGASQPTGNDVIIIAVDMDNGSMWVGKNGTWFNSSGTANPATNTDPRWTSLTGTTWFPYMAGYGTTSPVTCYINFGQQGFKYTPPTGFVALNTYNL